MVHSQSIAAAAWKLWHEENQAADRTVCATTTRGLIVSLTQAACVTGKQHLVSVPGMSC